MGKTPICYCLIVVADNLFSIQRVLKAGLVTRPLFFPQEQSNLWRSIDLRSLTGISMEITIGSDHPGFAYKDSIRKLFADSGHKGSDFGTFSDATVDYPDFIRPVAEEVARGEFDRGIVLGGSCNGEAIVPTKSAASDAPRAGVWKPPSGHANTTTPTFSRSVNSLRAWNHSTNPDSTRRC